MVGTPTVSTSVGMEGLQLKDAAHVLQADDPQTFADAVARLVTDRNLWERLAAQGRSHIEALHGREVVRSRWLRAIDLVLARRPKELVPDADEADTALSSTTKVRKRLTAKHYQELKKSFRAAVQRAIPVGQNVMVVSRGDDQLLELTGCVGWHFPQSPAGLFAGYYPADSAAAIAHLEELRTKGGRYLVFPSTAFWWLEHYKGFREHLEKRYSLALEEAGVCLVYDLSPSQQSLPVLPGHSQNGTRTQQP
jgi:hypothetical protein